jgi:hypothetical protein
MVVQRFDHGRAAMAHAQPVVDDGQYSFGSGGGAEYRSAQWACVGGRRTRLYVGRSERG